jgi:hypothetical protein
VETADVDRHHYGSAGDVTQPSQRPAPAADS